MSSSPLFQPAQRSSASMTQLPPSPELKESALSNLHGNVKIPDFSLDGSPGRARVVAPAISSTLVQRLSSVARYQAFHPQALACSNTLTSSLNDEEIFPPSLKSHPSTSTITHARKDPGPSSLGALAGPTGVALFRLSRPHVPLLMLSHATNSTNKSSISSLAFQPTTTADAQSNPRSLYLAATRGSGVLIWDASGHSPNPLIGRLGMDHENTSAIADLDNRITSISWKASAVSPLLATTTSTSLSLWDLRSHSQGSTSNIVLKPVLRFGTARKSFTNHSPLVQVACSSDSDECATIDVSGIVRVYDIRMTERGRSFMGSPTSAFAAHETAGVGISYFRSTSPKENNTTSRWLTWGLEGPLSSPVVKIWSNESKSHATQSNQDTEDYWYMDAGDASSPRYSKGVPSIGLDSDYHLEAQCARPNLACARVCASPVENSFMAVGHLETNEDNSEGGWWADLFTLSKETEEPTDTNPILTTFGLSKVAGFHGGSAASSSDRRALVSVLGSRVDLGRLQAAELAFSGATFRSRSISIGENPVEKKEEDNSDVELLLCCLSDTGVVTTHVIPEATPKDSVTRGVELGLRDHSPKRISRSIVRTAFPISSQTRIYPEDKEGSSLVDAAAGFWGTKSTQTGAESTFLRGDDGRPPSDQHGGSPQKAQSSEDPLVPPNRRGIEGGLMPFDMDVPVAYGSVTSGNLTNLQIGITDIASGNVVSSTGIGAVEENDPVSVDVRDSTFIMENIETERVPCPRLCGASFGFGNGGLVVFHNGEVKKMWGWYKRTDTIRLSNLPGGKGETTTDPESLRMVHNTSGTRANHPLSTQVEGSAKPKKADENSGPRTLKELVHMMTTAKETQWGERNGLNGADSDGTISSVENFFEDESLGSNSSDSEDDAAMTAPPAAEIYKRYFGERAWKGTVEKVQASNSPTHPQGSQSPEPSTRSPFLGPSSDMLAPVVSVTHAYDSMMLNRQSMSLAKGWELGGWDANSFDTIESYQPNAGPKTVELETEKLDTMKDFAARTTTSRRGGLPHYRYLSPAPVAKQGIPRPKSDPNMGKVKSQGRQQRLGYHLDEPGVHGGEYSVRPNMEESMTFLKKLFTHQQEGGAGFPNLMSPPDSPLLLNSLSKSNRSSSTGEISPLNTSETITLISKEVPATKLFKLGVYTICEEKKGDDNKDVKELKNMKRICLHNSSVCEAFGETEKEGVWKLLAQTIESQMEDEGKTFNGWGGNGGGALGADLVSNLLKYYEGLGDVQMLATIFCVLSGGHRTIKRKGHPYLLPLGQEERYDSYIKRYAELLYGWGLLSIRAELNKHLLRIPNEREGDVSLEEKADPGRAPGIAVVVKCSKCGRDADFNTNMCRTCQDYAFRCSICDQAVRGLFTVCDICNHGGHVEHMKSWFTLHSQCPTGCGCHCTFSPLLAQPTLPQQTEIGA